jgi:hypothetical protein
MLCLDKYGWPVTGIKGRYVLNLIRLLLYTRRIVRGHWDGYKVCRKPAAGDSDE